MEAAAKAAASLGGGGSGDSDAGGELPTRGGGIFGNVAHWPTLSPDAASGREDGEGEPAGKRQKKKVLKNPDVDTSFLPDRAREAQEERERERLAEEWRLQQEAIKNEPLEIVYSYWDGTGHRKKITCRKASRRGPWAGPQSSTGGKGLEGGRWKQEGRIRGRFLSDLPCRRQRVKAAPCWLVAGRHHRAVPGRGAEAARPGLQGGAHDLERQPHVHQRGKTLLR